MINFTFIIAKRNKISGTIQFIEKKNAPHSARQFLYLNKNLLAQLHF